MSSLIQEAYPMTIIRLKAKNQITIPSSVAKRLGLKLHEFLAIDVEDNFIKLIPVHVEPKYSQKELKTIDEIVMKEKPKGKVFKSGKQVSEYLKKL
jgi:bifunctional DNA-binding transcriptional regulator/antitoxin component of YhaV-PrlF toxin-antitoxin module